MFDQQKRVAFGLVLVSGAATSAVTAQPALAQEAAPPAPSAAPTAPSAAMTAATPHCAVFVPPIGSGVSRKPSDMRCYSSEQEAAAAFIDPTGTGFRAAGGVALATVYDDPRAIGQSYVIWGTDCNIGPVNVPAPLDNQVSITHATSGCAERIWLSGPLISF